MEKLETGSLRERLSKVLDSLVEEGIALANDLTQDKPKIFGRSYQQWYTKALGAIRALVPDRLDEFRELYEGRPTRKVINRVTYSIKDFALGVSISPHSSLLPEKSWAWTRVNAQVLIIESAATRLDDILSNVRGVMQAELLDSEIEAARHLLNSNHVRAAGALAGVVLERHLKQMCSVHNLTSRKRNPTISDWNELLKEAGVFDVPQWRAVQHLADIRNLCDHPKEREPTNDEVDELIRGVDKSIKTLF